ncbi:hypothetical protein FQN53_004639 [Emmonsiellopsis sp. PD_33]|nr:hypothetical protein FQN53_004639 [Emmonsiellopsis sp. PD_33]
MAAILNVDINFNVNIEFLVDVGSLIQAFPQIDLAEIISHPGVQISVIVYLLRPGQDGKNNGSGSSNRAIYGAAGCFLAAAAAPVAIPLALGAVGFGSAGVGAATLAAAWQSSIGSVAAGSLFATFTSAGMGGAGLATVTAGTVGASAGAGTVCLAVANSGRASSQGGQGHGGNNNGGNNGGGEGGHDSGDDGDGDDGKPTEKNHRTRSQKQSTAAGSKMSVLTLPKGQPKSKKQLELEAASKLRWTRETKFGSRVAFYVREIEASA